MKLSWFWRRCISVFTIYGHGGHLDKRTVTIYKNFQSPFDRRLHVKIEENWPRVTEEKSFKVVGGRTDDDGRQVITIAHPEPCSGELKKG